MSEAVLNMEEAERDRPKPKEPPRLLIGMSDVRVKIGTDIQFYAKGRLRPSMSVEQVLSEHHILNSANCTKIHFPKYKLNIILLHNMPTEHILN